jgi:hypothetical protein
MAMKYATPSSWETVNIDMDHPSFGWNMYTQNTGNESSIKRTQEPAAIKLAKEMKALGRTHDVKI